MSENNTDYKSKSAKGPKSEASAEKKPQHVLIDYNGTIGRATVQMGALSNNRSVPHKLSPLLVMWPENGQSDLVLQPGLNIADASLWKHYTETVNDGKGAPQLMDKVARGCVKEIKDLPVAASDMIALIDRSIDIDALHWIEAQEMAGPSRDEVIDAVRERLAKAHPVSIVGAKFVGRVPNLPRERASEQPPSVAMG